MAWFKSSLAIFAVMDAGGIRGRKEGRWRWRVGADMWGPHVSGRKRKKEARARSAAGRASAGLRARERKGEG